MNKTSQGKIIAVLAALMLFLTYIACGFAVCAGLPITTEKLSLMTSNFEDSPYTHEDLVALAVETRDFTVDDYGRKDGGLDGAEVALATNLLEYARASSDKDSPTHDRWSYEAIEIVNGNDPSPDVTMEKLYETGAQYSFDLEAISHLNDVNDLISRLFMPLLGVAVLAAFCMMAGVRQFGYRCAANALLYAGCATFAILAVLGLWATFGFSGFFAALHSLFFADGTWVFPADSLLITMYPQEFWIGMGIVWLSISCLLAVLSIIAGVLLRSRTRRREAMGQ